MADIKKKTGRNGEYQSGCNLVGAMRKSAPKADWCRVERMAPNAVAPMVNPVIQLRTFLRPSHSKMAGLNSMNWTVKYKATCHPTKNITEVTP